MKGTSSFAAIARPTRVFPDPLPPITFTRRTSRDDIDPFAAMAQRRSWNSDRVRPADAAIGPLRPPRVTVWASLRHGWIGSGGHRRLRGRGGSRPGTRDLGAARRPGRAPP